MNNHHATEETAVEEMVRDGFEATAKAYAPGKTEPHQHDYDVCLYIVEGEIRLAEVETGTVHVFRAGEQALVNRGTLHSEEHGALKMVVGRRH
jgi:uncharacterized cupin superfamily protein